MTNQPTTRPVGSTTTESRRAAQRLFRSDWDAKGTTAVYLPTDIAHALLEARGWEIEEIKAPKPYPGTYYTYYNYVSPDRESFWELSEALQLALSAEVL